MLIKRLICAAAASVMLFSAAALAVYADEEKTAPPLEVDDADARLTSSNEPALSFDGSGFDSYIHLTRDADEAGVKFSQDKNTYYQGNSLKVSVNTSGIEGYMSCSGMVRDADNKAVYPDAPEAEETDKMKIIGIELHSEDFGLNTFDGCTVRYTYRLTPEDEAALQGSAVWVFAADADNVRVTSNPKQHTVNTTLDDNVSQYKKDVLSIGQGMGSSKIIFEIPTSGALNGDALFLDNITIILPDEFGESKYVKNVDGYNPKAEPREIIDEIQISKAKDVTTESKKTEENKKVSPVIIIVIVIVVAGVGVGGYFVVKKMRNRFY